jgi:hypothetical protein
MSNPETELTLDDAVAEVLGILTGLDLEYAPEQDRYRSITRAINRALRANSLEVEWSYYSDQQDMGPAFTGQTTVDLPDTMRARIIGDDAVRLADPETGQIRKWAYFMERSALSKYQYQGGLWVTLTRSTIDFNRPIGEHEAGLSIMVPVMREPEMFRLPHQPSDPEQDLVEVPLETRNQLVDFQYPDVVILRAAFYYAQTDPVMQPRVQTLEAQYKDLMYQVKERDERNTDMPFLNNFEIPMEGNFVGPRTTHGHPHA